MAQNAPTCKDTQDFQFKLHDKCVGFKKCGGDEARSNVKLLAISSTRGLLFAGHPTQPELKVIILKDLVNGKTTGQQPQARLVPLPSVPNYISCSSDGNLLAVNHTQNGTSLLSIYSVPSFMTPDIRPLYSIRLAPEDYVHAVQLLWNPVLPNSLAVVLSNGALGMYALKEGGNFEMHSLDKSQQVKCGCWSPKGKQIVLGFPAGKLQQFKPDLTPAKTLLCPPNVHDAPFDTIGVQWLSTFQFAVIFLQHGEDCNPSLYILNAPKAGTPSYINYYDICYSLNGPRNHQFLFTHVPQWNVLLVTSANGVEVGIMGTTEAGDTPTWQQFTLLDEARIELPLSEATQEETFPLGFVYDTSSTHQLIINEQKLQTMPMVHVLGTDGTLLSFNFLNLQSGAVSVCSPPPPVADTSGQFRPLNTLLGSEREEKVTSPVPKEPQTSAPSDISFAFTPNTVTSTPAPAKDKSASLFSAFGASAPKAPAPQLAFGVAPPAAPLSFAAPNATAPKPSMGFGGFGAPNASPAMGSMFSAAGGNAFGGLSLNKPMAAPSAPAPAPAPERTAPATQITPVNKPLYTVPPTFTPVGSKPATASARPEETFKLDDTEPIIKDMIALQIESFNQDIQKQKDQTRQLLNSIAAPSALRTYAKRLDDLQELNEQAKDVEFELDVQGLRQGLNEAYAIVAECRGKLEIYRKPDITRLMNSSACDPAGRRMLARLQSYVAANEAQLRLAQQHIDVEWEQFQDVLRRNSKSRMHMPCLEGIYQRLTRLQNLASDQRIIQNNIKAKLKERGLLQAALLDQEKSRTRTNEAVETLADSILSMSLSQTVDSNAAKLTQERLKKIRKVVQQQKINIICPQRPDRVGLKSEVILETKRKQELIKKAAAKPLTSNKSTQAAAPAPAPVSVPAPALAPAPKPAPAPTFAAVTPQLAKPMPAKPVPVEKAGIPSITASPFSFSQSSPFVNTSTVTTTTNTLSTGEAAKPGMSLFGGMGSGGSSFSFGGGNAKTALSFGGSPATEASKPSLVVAPGKEKEGAARNAAEPEKPKAPPISVEPKATPEPTKGVPPQTPKADKSFGFAGFKGSGGAVGSASSSTFSFGGLGSSLGFGGAAAPKSEAAAPAPAAAAPFGMFSTAAGAKPSSGEATVTSSSSNSSLNSISSKPSSAAAPNVVAVPAPVSSSSDPTGGLFASVNICKPNTKDTPADATKPGNLFGGFGSSSNSSSFSFGGAAGDTASKGFFASIAPAATTAAVAPEAAATPALTATTAAATTKPEPVTTTTAPSTTASAPASAPAPLGVLTTTTATPSLGAAPALAPATAPAAAPAPATTAATSAPGSAFFSFSTAAAPAAGTPLTATNSAASTASSASVFGGFGTTAATTATGPVGSSPFQTTTTSAAPTGNIFGSVPKPEGNVFGTAPTAAPAVAATATAPPSGLFASAAIGSSPSPFGSPTAGAAASGGNIFGQAAIKPTGFGQPAPGGAPGGSIFGGTSSSPFGSSSIFGGGNAQSPPAPGGTSLFGQNVFGQTAQAASPAAAGGNIFSNPVGSPQQPQPSAFGGGGGSIFGSSATAAASPASGGSIFGGGSASGGFGTFSQTSPAQGAFGSAFGGGGGSVAQTGFGSPQTPQQQPNPGGFGAKPVFGGSPGFGASPTFGGAPFFGSPKGFGGFGGAANVASPPAFGAPAPKPTEGNIFETLGGQDSGLSFGNLAQTGSANSQKPAFGGSSFMNYR